MVIHMYVLSKYYINYIIHSLATTSVLKNNIHIRRSLSLVSQSGAAYSRSHLARFACARFTLHAHKKIKKKCVLNSQLIQNALKRIEMHKKCLTPLTHYAFWA